MFDRVVKEFGDVKSLWDMEQGHAGRRHQGHHARRPREGGIEHDPVAWASASPPPPIEGEDIEGKPMKLSDFKGKVVVLDFGMEGDGLCRVLYPYERSLVKRLESKPFVLLGINVFLSPNEDTDREGIQESKEGAGGHLVLPGGWERYGWPDIHGLERPFAADPCHPRPRGDHPSQVPRFAR